MAFERLDFSAALSITRKYYEQLEERISAAGIKAEFAPEVIEAAAKNGFDPEQGARPLQRYIRENAEDPISELLLSGKIASGDKIFCRMDGDKMVTEKESAVLQNA